MYKRQAFGNVDWGLTFAAIVISILPPLIIYFALNKWVTAGGLFHYFEEHKVIALLRMIRCV